MQEFIEIFEQYFHYILTLLIHILEIIGVIVLLNSALKSVISYCRKDPTVKLTFAQGMAMALEFKLAGEILRTVVVREWNEILIVGAIIVLRAGLSFLIHWEINNETRHYNPKLLESETKKSKE